MWPFNQRKDEVLYSWCVHGLFAPTDCLECIEEHKALIAKEIEYMEKEQYQQRLFITEQAVDQAWERNGERK